MINLETAAEHFKDHVATFKDYGEIKNEVMKKISVPVQSDDPVLPKVVLDETLHLEKPGDVEIPMHSFMRRNFDPFSVCEFNAGEERRRRKENG